MQKLYRTFPKPTSATPNVEAQLTESWWDRYANSLESAGLSETSREVIATDCEYIVNAGILGSGTEGVSWPPTRNRSGLVMGAVQSGKTASMLGVLAMSIDAQADIVILLAGTRTALWMQTYERLMQQFNPSYKDIFIPTRSEMKKASESGVSVSDLYHVPSSKVEKALRKNKPIIMVVMKHGQHLHSVSEMLHNQWFPLFEKFDRNISMLVIDDEADDGSILDAVVEANLDPAFESLKQLPRHIVDLWAKRENAPETAAQNLYATYLAYTATPQANFLQVDQNPLAPKDFVAALRTPGQEGEIATRSISYFEPSGLGRYYTGGEVFYKKYANAGNIFAVTKEDIPEEPAAHPQGCRCCWLGEAIRSYLVAGAVRLSRDTKGRRASNVDGRDFESQLALGELCPDPHTMLFHPSANVSDHFDSAAELLAWSSEKSVAECRVEIVAGRRTLDRQALEDDMSSNPEAWEKWLDSYKTSGLVLHGEFNPDAQNIYGEMPNWPDVEELIRSELLPYVRISIVNSSEDGDKKPEFGFQEVSGRWSRPQELFTIFVSGNVMARGLTLEGLTTTLFLRGSNDPVSDTQMQMQRWFGYRGKSLDVCRIFSVEEQFSLFRSYHEVDAGMRQQILTAMNQSAEIAPLPMTIEGANFRATGKIANVSKIALRPSSYPFTSNVNSLECRDPNIDLVSEFFASGSREVEVNDKVRGRLSNKKLSLLEAADLLDQMRYSGYGPKMTEPYSRRWQALQLQLGLSQDANLSEMPFYRGYVLENETSHELMPSTCPYNIAAYLRLWSACLEIKARGLFPHDNPNMLWQELDLNERKSLQPNFNVGIRFGSMEAIVPGTKGAEDFAQLSFPVRPMKRTVINGQVTATWGSRNPGSGDIDGHYLGDQFFDFHDPVRESVREEWMISDRPRPMGQDGQILFHVIKSVESDFPVLALGIALPLGGPDHFASFTGGNR
jgi:hypothetical protein